MQTASTELSKRDTRFKRKTGDEVHASGTIIHWDVRDPDDPYGRIWITCHGCGKDSFVPKASIKNPSWRGLCSDCVMIVGKVPKKLTGRETLDSGAVVDWDDVDPKDPRHRRVYCPNFSRCGGSTFKRIDAGNKNRQPFYCRPCFIEYRRSRMADAWGAARPGKGSNLKKRGHQQGDNYLDRDRLKADFRIIVHKLRAKLSNREIGREAIALEFQKNGESIGKSAVTKRVQLIYGKGVTVARAVELAQTKA